MAEFEETEDMPRPKATVAPEPEPVAPPPGPALWDIGEWNGLPNYLCGFCPYASTEEQEIGEHVYARHMREPAAESPKPRVDRYGNLT